MKTIAIAAFLAAAVMSAPAVTYSVVNDCHKETVKEVPIVLPDGKIVQGVTCTVVPRVVADTVVADTTKKK